MLQGSSSYLNLVNSCELGLCPCSFCVSVERRLGKNVRWMALRKRAIAVARIKFIILTVGIYVLALSIETIFSAVPFCAEEMCGWWSGEIEKNVCLQP